MRLENLEKLRKAAETGNTLNRLRSSQKSQISTQPAVSSQPSQSQNSRWGSSEGLEVQTWVARTEISSSTQRLLSVASQTAVRELKTAEANTEIVELLHVPTGTDDLVEVGIQASQTDGNFLSEEISDQLARIDEKLDQLLTTSQSQKIPTSSPPPSQGPSVYKSLLKRRTLTQD